MPRPVDDPGLDDLRDDGRQILCGALDGGVIARDGGILEGYRAWDVDVSM